LTYDIDKSALYWSYFILLVLFYLGGSKCSNGCLWCCWFAVDSYATVAKEKHGYNMEQVLCIQLLSPFSC